MDPDRIAHVGCDIGQPGRPNQPVRTTTRMPNNHRLHNVDIEHRGDHIVIHAAAELDIIDHGRFVVHHDKPHDNEPAEFDHRAAFVKYLGAPIILDSINLVNDPPAYYVPADRSALTAHYYAGTDND